MATASRQQVVRRKEGLWRLELCGPAVKGMTYRSLQAVVRMKYADGLAQCPAHQSPFFLFPSSEPEFHRACDTHSELYELKE